MTLVKTVFIVGIIVFSMISILGLIYITKLSFSTDNNKCGKLTKTEKGIARLTTVLLWIQILWVVLGVIIQTICFNGVFNDT